MLTDGSSQRGSKISGSAVHVRGKDFSLNLSAPVLTQGNNYLSELAALTFAVLLAPKDSMVKIYSDSLAAISAINDKSTSERAWVRTPCRGWLKELRSQLTDKPHVSLHYVRAHTARQDKIRHG